MNGGLISRSHRKEVPPLLLQPSPMVAASKSVSYLVESCSLSLFHRYPLIRALLRLNINPFSRLLVSPATPKCNLFLQHNNHHHQSHYNFSTTCASDPRSFTVSYLINTCGLSQEDALRACRKVRFETPKKPDLVLAFFRNYGFSNTQIKSIICRSPGLLTRDTSKGFLPKIEFFVSKGASHSDISLLVTKVPEILGNSLEKCIIPNYELLRRFCPSDEKAISIILACPFFLRDSRFSRNVKMLLDERLTCSNIYHLLCTRASVLCSNNLSETVQELKQMGFNPSKVEFSKALRAKTCLTKSNWDAKVEAMKTRGWSEQEIFHAFLRHPLIMLQSKDKLNAVMNFWIHQLGWDPSVLLRSPIIFAFSLEKRLVPRASVIQYLLSNGLMKENASLATPFSLCEKLFLQKFVTCFEENDTSRMLKLYKGDC